MDTCSINWWETFKAWTPYIMGLIVFSIWHFQKGKEVIANESKEIIKNINIYKSNIFDLMNEAIRYKKEKNTNGFIESDKYINTLIVLKNLSSNIEFLLDSTDNKKLLDLVSRIGEFHFDLEDLYIKYIEDSICHSELFSKIDEIYKTLDSIKKIALGYALYEMKFSLKK
jgi:hypothetical protein